MKKIYFFAMLFMPFFLQGQDLSQGLIGHWPLDGHANDLSVNSNHGTVVGAIPVENRLGETGKALYFNGGNYIDFGDVADMGVGDLSMSAWFKIDPSTSGTLAIASKSIGHDIGNRYAFGIDNRRVRAFFDPGTDVNFQGNTIIQDDSWHLVTVTYDRDGQLKIFLDGVLDGSRNISGSQAKDIQSNYSFFIGEYIRNKWGFKGAIDDVRVYNRALSPEEIILLYEGTEERNLYQEPVFSNENYVYTRTLRVPVSSINEIQYSDEVMENVMYFDGLGRPVQHIGIKQAGGTGHEDIITHIGYDEFGRQDKTYLPYPEATGDHGSFRTGDISGNTESYYQAVCPQDFTSITINPYSETHFEASPLNRIKEQGAPGADWAVDKTSDNDHTIKYDYGTNIGEEVRMYSISLDGSYTPTLTNPNDVFYGGGQLYKTIVKDENWQLGQTHPKDHTTETFKDKQGRVVLKRTYNNGDEHDTYYVYDDYGNLTYVLPPKAEATGGMPNGTELAGLCYQYKYDHRNRLIEKKVPGKGWEYIVYNKLDRPVMTQDAVQRQNDEWLFAKYDAFGRVAYTGLFESSYHDRESLQVLIDDTDNYEEYVKRTSSGSTYAGTTVYYNNDAIPNGMEQIYTINYYDSYDDLNIAIPNSNSLGTTIEKGINTKGLETVSKVRVLGTNKWITTAMGYDKKGRKIWRKTVNTYLDTEEIVEHDLDFSGNIKVTKTIHEKDGQSPIVIVDNFEYDHVNRLTEHTQTLDGETELIAENTYDALGELTTKGVGNTPGNPLQDIGYDYNVRGWLKEINSISSTQKLFNFKLFYNDPTSGTPLYNGNISQTRWRTNNDDSSLKTYTYGYDALNRITDGIFNVNTYSLTGIAYDKNGNITSLQRNKYNGNDNFGYTYSGNQLTSLSGTDPGSFSYDGNGNMITDSRKDITDINYNYLNLPTNIAINGGNIQYIYGATGTKQRKVVGSTTTDYAGNYIYKNGSLTFFVHPEGYVEYDNGNFNYIFQYKDHLGNIRLSYKQNGTTSTGEPILQIQKENNYYPFGLTHKGYNNSITGTENIHKTYQSKELEKELGLNWHDFGARRFMADIGRWTTLDPLSEKFYPWSPYNTMMNSPIYFIDPDGRSPVPPGDYYDKQGTWLYNDGIDDGKVYEVSQMPAVSSDIEGSGASNIEYVGQVENVKMTFTGEANSENPKQADGQLNVIQEVSNGKEYTRASFDAVGGPWGNGSPENGDYKAHSLLDRGPNGWYNKGMTVDGIGFSLNIDPLFETGRSLLRIHPDGGNYFGTQGCIGLDCGKSGLSKFRGLMQSTLSKQDYIPLNINILNNPNNNGYGTKVKSNGE